MRLPEFTAEASLVGMRRNYTGISTKTNRPGTGSVMAQWDFTAFSPDYWAGLATLHHLCPTPFCNYDYVKGQCHCLTAGFHIN
jgi:hypothetical protein